MYKLDVRFKLRYALSPIITAFLLLIIYAVKHIYPFGINTIDYFDMGQQIVPFYYHVYDCLHGTKNLFYDQYTALSVNMAMSTSGCSNLSLFNLFFLLVKRDAILESLSIFLMLKMMCMSFFMYFYLDKRFEIPFAFKCLFSVGYAFSGYVLTLYMTIQWLDIAALFPLLMYFLGKLLTEGKYIGYIVVLAMMFIASYYLTIMILMYIFLMVGIDVVLMRIELKGQRTGEKRGTNDEKSKCNLHLLNLLLSTVSSIMISMFIFLPQICQTLISARFNNENEGGLFSMYHKIISTVTPAYTARWWTLAGLSFAFAVIIYGLIKYRKENKTVFIVVVSLFIVLSELVLESVNLFWHFGSYVLYPIRNGFLINFTVAVLACMLLEKMSKDGYGIDGMEKPIPVVSVIVIFASLIIAIVCITVYNAIPEANVRKVFHYTSAFMVVMFVLYLSIIWVKKGKYLWTSLIVIMAEFIVFGYIFIGLPTFTTGYTEDTEQTSEFIRICNQLNKECGLDDEENALLKRVKNPDTSLNANYGLVLKRPTLSNWTHLLSPSLQSDAAGLGYSVQYTRLLDAGGTVFSDTLIGIDTLITCLHQDDDLYTLTNTVNVESDHITGERADYYLYECKYELPFGIITNSTDFSGDNICERYNKIYSSLGGEGEIAEYLINGKDSVSAGNTTLGGDGNIVEDLTNGTNGVSEGKITVTDEVTRLATVLNISGNKALYYISNQIDCDDYNTSILVNGEQDLVPSIREMDNTLYPAHFNNNALYLGSFCDEVVEIEVDFRNYDRNGNALEHDFNPGIIAIDLDKLQELTTNYDDIVTDRQAYKSGYSFTVDMSEDGNASANVVGPNQWLVLPISYDKGYSATVNGINTELIPVGGMFMAIPLLSGINDIRINFMPYGMKLGIIISIISLILLIVVVVTDRKYKYLNRDYRWLNNLYVVAFVVCLLVMYVIPYVYAVISIVS